MRGGDNRDHKKADKIKGGDIWTVIGSGSSLTKADCETARSKTKTIVVNDSFRLLPNADIIYACDKRWWDVNYDDVLLNFKGERYSINDLENPTNNPSGDYLLNRVDSIQRPDFGRDRIHYGIDGGGNSAFQSANLAAIFGAKTILLLGVDCCGSYFGGHPNHFDICSPFQKFIDGWSTITSGINIINCSRFSAVNCFPKTTIDKIFE